MSADSITMDLYERRTELAEVLKAHQPTTDEQKRIHKCSCGLEFHFVDARSWPWHATAMVLKLIEAKSARVGSFTNDDAAFVFQIWQKSPDTAFKERLEQIIDKIEAQLEVAK